jgi:hypothetical protein
VVLVFGVEAWSCMPQHQESPHNSIVLTQVELRSKRTGSSTDVIESKISDEGVELEEEREGLADTAAGTKDGNLGELLLGLS